jgi:hypothetical protein
VDPFDEATALIAEMTGVVVPKRSAETTVVEAAVDFEAFYAARTKGGAKPVPQEILVGVIDCMNIPMVKPEGAAQEGRQAQQEEDGDRRGRVQLGAADATPGEVVDSLFATGKRPSRGARPTPTHKRVWASLLSRKDAFIADVKTEMVRHDPLHRRTWVMVTDGERALQRRVCTTVKGVTLVLDLLHVL